MAKKLDFNKIEVLRKRLKMTIGEMAAIFEVSRVTYHRWVQGFSLRAGNEEHVRTMLRKLATVATEHKWPDAATQALAPEVRQKRLLALLKRA